jgi:hypothetical protein
MSPCGHKRRRTIALRSVRLRIPKIEPRIDAGLKGPMSNARKGADRVTATTLSECEVAHTLPQKHNAD